MKVQNPIIGRARGSAGGMTFCKNYDKNVARAKAFEVSNPKTALQTNQRTFFKEVMDITKTVSDEELRSLFGIKPKAMSRRNALSKQIAAAYSVVDGQKVVDFSKLQAIGNGEKVTTPIVQITDSYWSCPDVITKNLLNVPQTAEPNIIAIFFDSDTQKITIINMEDIFEENVPVDDYLGLPPEIRNGFFYLTCSTDGSNVSQEAFGTFQIKTRATKQSNAEPQPPTSIDVYANGITEESYFHFNENAYLKNLGYQPDDMENDGSAVCDHISFDSESNWWAGTLHSPVDTSKPIIINFVKSGEPAILVEANWIVQ